ncbi:hypothetical protein D3C78_990520 [compost metagenome]
MADEQQAGAGGAAFGKQQFEEGLAGIGVQRRGRFVGDHQFRLADQRAGGGDALLLADRQLVGTPGVQLGAEAEVLEQGGGRRGHAAMALARALGAQGREAAGQLDVGAHAEKRQQVELLEDVAAVVDAEAVAGAGRQRGQLLAEQAHAAALGQLHAAEQAEQGGLAAAAGTLEKQAFAALQAQVGDVQQLGMAGPGEAEVGEFDQR